MDQSISLTSRFAPAKINLALHVTGRRADGYHLIESLVAFTRFGDRISVEPAEADDFVVTGPFAADVPADSGNLVVKARDRLRQLLDTSCSTLPPSVLPDISPTRGEIGLQTGFHQSSTSQDERLQRGQAISPLVAEMSGRTEGGTKERSALPTAERLTKVGPVLIRLEKNLPVASGVGGGSSDAAAVLKALTHLWVPELPHQTLHEIGLPLGADVPMCLDARPLIARGIGDQLSPVPTFPALAFVLVNPGAPVSTAAVFAALAGRENAPLPPLPKNIDFHSLRNWLEMTRNDLEAPARGIEPAIGKVIAALNKAGSGFSRMSGSGATCFGLFETNNVAKRAAAAIRARHPDWFVAATRSIASEGDMP